MKRNTKKKQIASAVVFSGRVRLDISTPTHPEQYMLCDFETFIQWRDTPECGRVYAKRTADAYSLYAEFSLNHTDKKREFLYFHQFATMGKWENVGHKNKNGLDNRVCNLQNVSNELYPHAQRRTPSWNTSGVKGVTWNKTKKKWQAGITIKGEYKNLGYFHKLKDASDARRQAEVKYWG